MIRDLVVRQSAVDLARTGALIGPSEMRTIFGYAKSRFAQLNRAGAFEAFKVKPALGPRCFSGVLVTKYLNGDPLFIPTFGQKRRRA